MLIWVVKEWTDKALLKLSEQGSYYMEWISQSEASCECDCGYGWINLE